jgi:hypothetical protein
MATPVEIPDTAAPRPPARRTRRTRWLVAAAAATVLLAVAVTIALTGSTSGSPRPTGKVVALKLPGGGASMSSCIRFDEAILAQMPLAFAGTVTAVGADSVTLDVDRWYRAGPDGEASTVQLRTPGQGTSLEFDGVTFESGQHYLVAATDGNVNGCGYSGAATTELKSAYDRAFS